MKTVINGAPSFAYLNVILDPGETIIAESDAMSSMSADLSMSAKLNGGFISGFIKKFLGGESLFVNHFTNTGSSPMKLTLVQATPGDMIEKELKGDSINFQPGAYIASTPGAKLGVKWAGFKSWFAKEGLFKLVVKGNGKVWYGAYGGLLEKEVDGAYIVDSSHLVSYPENFKLNIQLAGGLFSSFFGGEGFVTRVEGKGKITIQTRSMDGLKNWVNPKI